MASDYSGPGVEAELTGTLGGEAGYGTLYTARAASTGGRSGRVTTDDGLLDLEIRVPEQLGGPGGAPNPEQLMAAAYAACFHNSLTLVAGRAGVDATDAGVEAAVELRRRGRQDDYVIGVDVTVHLPEVDPRLAGRIVEQAHEHCPYSRALLGNVEVGLHLA
ncbi:MULTISPECIES: Ohr family peroxiredoxin [Streptosporangium]|uniref:Ohr subfamily peroxiredoxin n=1 Tax=Streptosporangium brasiliense TaxID=47480 RepID=A0ABT9QWN3_9ACTN|nr:Ohr family peroxiredoxin [Streptosporangium brasiliense]MDP9861383.1 Ohr subfamily peroxiredoxin [Streptosporangium brasiliense]